MERQDFRGWRNIAHWEDVPFTAEGESVLSGLAHIDRGYEALEDMICRLGGRARRR